MAATKRTGLRMRKGFPEGPEPCNRKAVPPVIRPVNWTAPDGSRLGGVRWEPVGETRARVIAIHGLSCRAEDFSPLALTLVDSGIRVEAWNLRGQGLDPDPRRRGTWLDVEGTLTDLEAFAGTDDLPLFLCGESMGAKLAICAAARAEWKARLAGLLLFVPVIGLARKTPSWIRHLLRGIAAVAPNVPLKPGWFISGKDAMPPLTRIRSRQQELMTAPHRLGPLGVRFLVQMGDLIERAAATAPEVETPVALFSAGHDAFLRTEQTEAFFQRIAAKDRTHFHYPESFHQLLYELNTAEVLRDALAWIEARIPTGQTSR